MSFEKALVKHLRDDAELLKLIDRRINPLFIPEGEKTPCLTYQIINNKENKSIQGDMSYEKIRVQIDCWANSYSHVKEIRGAVKNALNTFKYQVLNFTSRDGYEKETKLYRQLIDFNINT